MKDICDSAENALIDRIKDYEEEKSSIEDFKQSLSEYVADCGAGPLVFIIDELDRCNPNYAVKLLETVKHIFDVPNIVFVLSICRKELENSIRGFYGSDRIDATNYLRRFIDIQFDIPHPKSDKFCQMLIQYYGFNDYFLEEPGGQNSLNEFYDMVALMFSVYDIDLRTWDRIFAHSRLAAIQLGSQAQLLMNLIFLLCFLQDYKKRKVWRGFVCFLLIRCRLLSLLCDDFCCLFLFGTFIFGIRKKVSCKTIDWHIFSHNYGLYPMACTNGYNFQKNFGRLLDDIYFQSVREFRKFFFL